MSLVNFLPAPKHVVEEPSIVSDEHQEKSEEQTAHIPPYGKRKEAGFVPRTLEDFGDGGAFPEIHVPQYPLDMGRKKVSKSLSIHVDSQGAVKYDAVVRQNMRPDQIVYSTQKDLMPYAASGKELEKPNQEETLETVDKTRMALEKIIQGRNQVGKPQEERSEPTYVRYQSDRDDVGSKLIQVHEKALDPLEPPKFKHKRGNDRPPSPPVPVLHSPPRKLTAADHQAWKVPPSISHWKNKTGFAIPIHQRMAADGRRTVDVSVNEKFASLSESLYLAEKNARAALENRARMEAQVAQRQKEQREAELRKMAEAARSSRHRDIERDRSVDEYEEESEAEEREEMRRDLRRERKREMRMSSMSKTKRARVQERERDISEKIALGQAPKRSSKDQLFDQRLFDQKQGLGSGFGADDAYNAFDKPLFESSQGARIYRPSQVADSDMYGSGQQAATVQQGGRFQPDRGFQGAEADGNEVRQGRSQPVQFERETESDPFGLDKFLDQQAQRSTALDHIGQRGRMMASAGGAGTGLRNTGRIEFEEEKE